MDTLTVIELSDASIAYRPFEARGRNMSVRRTVSPTRLESAFRLAEDILRRSGEESRRVAREITDERKGRIEWEGQLNQVFKSAFEAEFSTPSYDVKSEEFERIDICLTRNRQIIAAIESKGMVSDDHTKRPLHSQQVSEESEENSIRWFRQTLMGLTKN